MRLATPPPFFTRSASEVPPAFVYKRWPFCDGKRCPICGGVGRVFVPSGVYAAVVARQIRVGAMP